MGWVMEVTTKSGGNKRVATTCPFSERLILEDVGMFQATSFESVATEIKRSPTRVRREIWAL